MEGRSIYMSSFRSLRDTMERASEIITEAYSKPVTELEMFTGELPPGHRSTDRRQRYWVTEHNGDMFVALPGTTHPLDWSSNLRVQYKPIDGSAVPSEQLEQAPCAHAGFYYRAETVPTLKLLQQAADRGCRLVLTGHSLGGAVANLCTLAALSAQKKALSAAADRAATAAAPQASRSKSKSKSKLECSPAVNNNHSCCSSNSDFALSPQAALVEVLCVSFASPVYANAALCCHIEDNGWEECFVNVVVPEDYCLKLFNGVLTSAQPDGKLLMSRSSSSSSLKSSQQLKEFAEGQDPYDPVPEPFEPADEPTDGTNSNSSSSSSADGSGDGSSNRQVPRYSYTGQQQPTASALAGKSARCRRTKRQLSFAHPVHSTMDDSPDSLVTGGETGAEKPVLEPPPSIHCGPDNRTLCSLEPAASGGSWVEESNAIMPSSPSSASLFSEESLSSTRSWTLLAYLPDMFTRSFSTRSFSSSGGSSSSSGSGSAGSSRQTSTGMVAAEAAAAGPDGWGMRHARSSVDLAHGLSLGSDISNSSSDSLSSLDTLAAHVSAGVTGKPTTSSIQQQPHQHKPKHQKSSLRKSISSASLTLLSQGHKRLLKPLTSVVRVPDSLAVVTQLLPSMRSVVLASRTVVNAASSLTSKAFSVPLNVLEVGLVKALKPPMYQPVGQQWILSATGLVPQHQPIHQYPRHVHDVFWHKELMLVAFREHSIVFYKQRLLKQAARR